ncbi:unnamed protein product [Linum tenue]|uniref:Oleosin n=2 Tax=Linum TaxID=4005 RepID=A0AAV0IU76_9ROSI|nr:unnamed protein product [Linum tenue]
MASSAGSYPRPNYTPSPAAFLHRVQGWIRRFALPTNAAPSSQLLGLLTLLITGSILLLLTGVTVTVAFLTLIFLAPLLIVTSPLWVPLAAFAFVLTAGFVALVATAGGLAWGYRYYRGMHPVGSDRVDYARSRIYDTAAHVKDYAREYGGYLQSRVKDAAPGA